MKTTARLVLSVAACLAAIPATAAARPYLEKAQAQTTPWSGYWWPLRTGGLVGPLAKYDQATGHRSVAWEKANRTMGPSVPRWFGFCHAWAASSLMDAEPRQVRNCRAIDGRPLGLGVGDQKGMLAACHTEDVSNSYGDRFGDGNGEEDPQDLAPDVLWRILKLYLGDQQVPLVADIEAGPEVWNFPVYAYEIQTDGTGDGRHAAVLTLWMVDDGVPADFVGSQVRRLTYTFTFEMRSGAVVMGSARWTGRSRQDHPDFAWYPYVARAQNPEVRHATVRELTGQTSPASPPAAPQPEPSAPQPGASRPQPDPPEVAARPQPLPGPDDPRRRLVLTPMELAALVANRTSDFALDVTVDRFDGGTYRSGEPISVRVRSGEAGYLYLFHLDNRGKLSLLYPLLGRPERIAAETPTDVPGTDDDFVFTAGHVPGLCRIKAVVTSRPIYLGGLVISHQQQQQVQQQQQQQQRQEPSADRPAAEAKSAQIRSAVVEQTFRFPPAQQEQVQSVLEPYARQNASQRPGRTDVRQTVGRFAQDEVVFIVEPAGDPGKPGQSQTQVNSQLQNPVPSR